ncbi:MAG: hypothetical protein AAF529_15105 [Pseudomonadota bacterium]
MDNHFHLVLHYDPREGKNWTDEEVAFRWCSAFQRRGICDEIDVFDNPEDFNIDEAIRYHDLLSDPERIIRCRAALSSLSRFMQHLKQPFAVWANKQDTCKGHFFESRFYSGVLLDESDLMRCMAYVDLNPVEAGIAKSLRAAKDTSIHERLYADRFSRDRLESYLAPLWESDERTTESSTHTHCRLTEYVKQLNLAIVYINSNGAKLSDQLEDWMARLLNRERNVRTDACYFDYA